jgi:poly(3-hydroxybutyrate) depolymerase
MSDQDSADAPTEHMQKFARWYEDSLDPPGRYYPQAIEQLVTENRMAQQQFVGLGRRLSREDIAVPSWLIAVERNDITTSEQVFAAEHLFGTPPDLMVQRLVPGGHIGLFMDRQTVATAWPQICRWIAALG